ncbi:hypothetical protein NDU88_007816 [Pleurodeles waltl]|uniref:Uncharacterized protein n=1 Tax=Pleurodeles waltl TaxID=8319 RepID=A0AAV7U106_PLEWA|nr:hypothetical protein NDU88_007816 [Pleurodeles waltl]
MTGLLYDSDDLSRGTQGAYQTRPDKFALSRNLVGKAGMKGALGPVKQHLFESETLTLKDIMMVMQGIRESLETKTDTVFTEVTLVRAEVGNSSARMKETEDSLSLKKQVKEMHATTCVLGAKLKDFECHPRRNNICVVGVHEKQKGWQ